MRNYVLEEIRACYSNTYPRIVEDGYTEEELNIWYVDAPYDIDESSSYTPEDAIIGEEIWIYTSYDDSTVLFAESIAYSKEGDVGDYEAVDIDLAKEIFEIVRAELAKEVAGVVRADQKEINACMMLAISH